jgi:hypothetical protein
MKKILHQCLSTVLLLGLLKFLTDVGFWLMNQSYDIAMTLGSLINISALVIVMYLLIKTFSRDFNTIKDLFTKK